MELKDGNHILSEEDLQIFKHFNVFPQEGKIKEKSDTERFVILFLCTRNHDKTQIVENCRPFIKEITRISEYLDNNDDISDIMNDLGVDEEGFNDMISGMLNQLPDVYSEREAKVIRRNANLNTLLNDE